MIQQLPSSMHSIQERLPSGKAITLFTRHSIREEGSGIASYDLPLTDLGRDLARFWGNQLSFPVVGAFSSPVGRCVETAELMLESHPHCQEVTINTLLTEPGSYVQDMMQVGGLFLKLGPQGFITRYLNEPLRGMLTPQQGAEQLLKWFRASQGEPGTITLQVSHDTVLAAFVYHLLSHEVITEEDWPEMMEGSFLWFDADVANVLWRDHHITVPFAVTD